MVDQRVQHLPVAHVPYPTHPGNTQRETVLPLCIPTQRVPHKSACYITHVHALHSTFHIRESDNNYIMLGGNMSYNCV